MVLLVLAGDTLIQIRKYLILLTSFTLLIHALLVFEVFLVSDNHLVINTFQIPLLCIHGLILEIDTSSDIFT